MTAGAIHATSSAHALRLTGVTKRFKRREALRGLNLEVPAGSIFGLIGPNGAGKTTAFSVACGFLRPDTGEVAILGGPGFDPARLKGRLTALPQDAVLGRETRCVDHLTYFARLQGMDTAEAAAAAAQALDEVGLGDRARERAKALSHGMLRRLGVAQALMGRPELVLLDEPTSGLDPRHAAELRDVLRRKRDGRTLLISSHNLTELESLCDHVAFIDRGVLVTSGATDVVTGKGQEIEIALGPGPEPVEVVRGALPGDTVDWEPDARVVRIRFAPTAGRAAEDVIGAALRALLDGGGRIAGVRRGTSLEKKFLEMT